MSIHKYQAAHVETASPLSVEMMAFNRVTAALEQCARENAKGRPADATLRIQQHVRLCDAVYQNSRLWIAILDDLISPQNRLAQDMKQRLASLGATSLTHGRKVLAGQVTPQLLIDINRAILTGLTQAREGVHPQTARNTEAAYASRQA
jgi:flagellar biosynthesis activator protein FlaF